MSTIQFSELPFPRDSGEHCGVYRITFDNGCFYIGGSTWLRHRLGRWKFDIKRNRVKNKNITNVLPNCKSVMFEVLEFVLDKDDVHNREDFYIKENWNNPLILNRCPSAFDNKGLKFNEQEVAAMRIRTANMPKKIYTNEEKEAYRQKAIKNGRGQRVGKYTLGGELIQMYSCIGEAAESVNVGIKTLGKIFKGKAHKTRGVTFRKIDDLGNIIQPPILLKKKRGRAVGSFTLTEDQKKYLKENIQRVMASNPEPFTRGVPPKEVIQYDKNGILIKVHKSVNKAANELNIGSGNICKVLKGERQSAKGFIFKYAS